MSTSKTVVLVAFLSLVAGYSAIHAGCIQECGELQVWGCPINGTERCVATNQPYCDTACLNGCSSENACGGGTYRVQVSFPPVCGPDFNAPRVRMLVDINCFLICTEVSAGCCREGTGSYTFETVEQTAMKCQQDQGSP